MYKNAIYPLISGMLQVGHDDEPGDRMRRMKGISQMYLFFNRVVLSLFA